jgi:catecholate siderophore receptor
MIRFVRFGLARFLTTTVLCTFLPALALAQDRGTRIPDVHPEGLAERGAAHVRAEAAAAVAAAAVQATFRFDIPGGSLDTVLAAFQSATGVTITVPKRTTVEGLSSPGVSGSYTVEHALDRLLAGTGLSFRLSTANTYALEVRSVAESVEVRASMPYRADISSTATKTLTPLRDIPQSVTVVTQAMIADLRMQNIADLVRYVPGVGMGQGEGNRDTPILRGNSTTADFFVDGVRDDVQYFRDFYNVERVEALKGPNAMIFGRGGAGGVINRATRQADWSAAREIMVQGGSHDNRRATFDLGHPVSGAVAARLTGMYENSGSYRRGVNLERYGFNPTLAFMVQKSTTIRVGYERFHDDRTADRGIPSFGGEPVPTDPSTFFGDPDASNADVTVNALTAVVDHKFRGDVLLRNRTRFADYDKFYQNVYPASGVIARGTAVSLSAYNNATERQNFFNQTDLNFTAATGRTRHVLLAGSELGRQRTDNFRNTGYFTGVSPTATSFDVLVSAPTVSVPLSFRQAATDADNHGVATIAAIYAQDQVEFSRQVHAIVGVRYDRFDVEFRNNRTGAVFTSADNLLSPRVGLIYKPVEPVSLYSSYSLAYQPRAGEQLSSLSLTNQALDPEKFTNYEVGAKWDPRPGLSFTTAVYRLDRTNVVIPDPADVTRSLLVDAQRTKGMELGMTGSITRAWSTMGAYAYQQGKITRTLSAAAAAGAVLAQVPAHTFSLWNRYDLASRWGVGLGIIHNSDMFTSTDNTVVLPGFTRVDGALFMTISSQLRGQVNVENLFDGRYYQFANGNNNITPGSPRAVRVSLTTRF